MLLRRLLSRPTAARLALACASTAAALVGVDLLAGFYFRPAPLEMSAEFHHVRPPGRHLSRHWAHDPVVVHFDAAGWRTAPGGPLAPGAPEFRLAVTGDSFVAALEVPWNETFVARLQARGDGRVEVLNRGVTASGALLALIRFRRLVARERPTHVLHVICENDFADDRRHAGAALRDAGGAITGFAPREAPSLVRRPLWLLLHRAWRGARDRAWHWYYGADPAALSRRWRWRNPQVAGPTAHWLRELAAEVRAAGATFTLSAVPRWRKDYAIRPGAAPSFSDNVGAWAAANGIRFVNLEPAFRAAAARDEPLFIWGDGHFTPAGHAVAAEALAAAYPALFAPEALRR